MRSWFADMKYKMLVMDMDGTLLSDEKNISGKNREALEEAYKRGVKIVISTGRIFTSAVVYRDMIGLDIPIIASNGAYIREKNDEVIYTKPLGVSNAMEIIKKVKEYKLYGHLFSWDTIFTEKLVYASFNYTKWNKGLPEDKRVKIHMIKDMEWEDIIGSNKDTVLKAVIADENLELLNSLRCELSKLDVEIARSYYNNIEIMNKGVSKGNAVDVLAQYYNISKDEVICIGDSENDISMLAYAGLGIAMENGTEDVKKAAKFITLSNQDDGVAYAIDKFLFNTSF